MGIPGLTTYISQDSRKYLEPFDLHDTTLVIDGNSLLSQLYNWHSKANCSFGGEYDKYSKCVENFFDRLLRCNVTPLVLLDGGLENKKLDTRYARVKYRIVSASRYTPATHAKFFPLMLQDVFKNVLEAKGVKFTQCLYEADVCIAAVAKILDCPVLSYDSDFYIFDVLYIPFDRVQTHVVRNPGSSSGYSMSCSIYKVENFISQFTGLDKTLLPLAATLLGNDYVKSYVFVDFFSQLKPPKGMSRKNNAQQVKIESTFHWLSKHTLNQAIKGILQRIPREKRRAILEVMETNINSYRILSPNVLIPLGFSKDFVDQVRSRTSKEVFKFQGSLETADTVEEDFEEIDHDLEKLLPPWFLLEFNNGNFPGYFIGMLTNQLYICPVQIEDYFYDSTILISLNIIKVIFGLLTSGTGKTLEYVIRGGNKELSHHKLEVSADSFSFALPKLENLQELPLIMRRGIVNETLRLPKTYFLEDFPEDWRLYTAAMVYWIQEDVEPKRNACHVYALMFSMLFSILDRKIGYIRTEETLRKRFGAVIEQSMRDRTQIGGSLWPRDDRRSTRTVLENFDSVTEKDCLMASSFLIPHFLVKLFWNGKNFNVNVVHVYAQFQNCLRHAMHLNALLGYPYKQPLVAELFNGTLLYNLYHNFGRRNDVESYVKQVLQHSPNLLALFLTLVDRVKSLVNVRLNEKVVSSRKRRKNRNRNRSNAATGYVEDESCEVEEDASSGSRNHFHDPNNCFSVLGASNTSF